MKTEKGLREWLGTGGGWTSMDTAYALKPKNSHARLFVRKFRCSSLVSRYTDVYLVVSLFSLLALPNKYVSDVTFWADV
jgi:hypothetical protein